MSPRLKPTMKSMASNSRMTPLNQSMPHKRTSLL